MVINNQNIEGLVQLVLALFSATYLHFPGYSVPETPISSTPFLHYPIENQNNCTMRISLSNNISLKIGIESILGYSMLINSRAFQMPIEVIQEENFSLQFKKSLNGNISHYIKLQYITYE